jgi:hypothetical protein
LFKLTLSNKLQNYLSMFCKKVEMESTKRTKGGSIGAREETKLLHYKAIPSDFNKTVEK